jgi:hypothetical protein
MRIRNKKKVSNYVNYKVSGIAKKALIPAGKTIDLPFLTNLNQILNIKDFNLGFLEVVKEEVNIKASKVETNKKKTEDALDKVKKEVKDYTDNKDNK